MVVCVVISSSASYRNEFIRSDVASVTHVCLGCSEIKSGVRIFVRCEEELYNVFCCWRVSENLKSLYRSFTSDVENYVLKTGESKSVFDSSSV